ncbi:MAG: SMP-30/gluconolactonase/LRE family protein [Verrucomicrobiota bacterium]
MKPFFLFSLLFPFAVAALGSEIVPEGAEVRTLATGFKFTEGPAKGPDGRVYFNDIPNERTHAYDPESGETVLWRENTGRANGLWWSPDGELLYCEGGARRVSRQKSDTITTVVDSFEGKKLNSPNDLVMDEHGGFFFTDPRYGKNHDDRELEKMSVYYVDAEGGIRLATDAVTKPNGVIFSLDQKLLYVADTEEKKIFVFTVGEGGSLSEKRVFYDSGSDGMTLDEKGNVYLTSEEVLVISPAGKRIESIPCPEKPANVTFGGPNNQTLYITARTGFYAIDLAIPGAW